MDARGQVRRVGVNINQAARVINAAGDPPIWLDHALAITNQAIARLGQAAAALSDVARTDRVRPKS